MRIITNIEQIDTLQWQQLVAESTTASWFQTQEAYSFYARMSNILTPFIVAVVHDKAPTIRGLCMGYITRNSNSIRQFFTRRAIIYGGPLLAHDATKEEVTCLMQNVRNLLAKDTIFVETRNFADFSRWHDAFECAGFAYQPHYDIHIECDTIDNMFARMQEGKRRQISKALQEGFYTTKATTTEDIHAFYLLLKQLYRKKVRTPLHPESFFQAFVTKQNGTLLLVKQANHVVGGMLCPIMGNTIYEWFVVGDVMATWAAMEYAQKHGLTTLDLMGAGEPNVPYGVRDFKVSMGGKLKEYGRYLCINKQILYTLGRIGITLIKRL